MNLQQFFVGRALVLLIVLIMGIGVYFFLLYVSHNRVADVEEPSPEVIVNTPSDAYENVTFTVAGEQVTLRDGKAESEAAPGSSATIRTGYFGRQVFIDLNEDGQEDVVSMLVQETGGTGLFFYVVAALKTDSGYVGSEAVFIGDRISPQSIEKGNGKVVVINYVDRAPGEPFSTPPSVGKSMRLILDPKTMQFGEVAQDFEGEADPEVMSLTMKSWTWISAVALDGTKVVPKSEGQFVLTLTEDGSFSAKTDCNSMGGKYEVSTNSISLTDIFSTKMFCEGSQESDFSAYLTEATEYNFTSKGELLLRLGEGGRIMVFR